MIDLTTFPGEWLLIGAIALVLAAFSFAFFFVADRIASHFAT